ncbi:peptidyl-prolyl cis-trans isomerase [Candidatus Shapirobacteria bacterium CG06_land_8_20_14_3_00_40_12]|uniref:Peptidyl-prolyl cis-trans isomerase n=2 Tax=Candidatus Shapironibacteriota TaxID=1752721 RepID=A0A2M7TT74_9BACT|nr:MAG: peptidyl-prolyl cis-trans isomerase [Candidatus Shapirobacteria bacterium CG06_land_8_20_14_3_00_40_12]PIZ59017.1 MAG: peptidyl-prolyl cis-trans isomerase [Candidatus Shapirobacteria bacterium CG_4_10_14_0_2_um_filter_40_12]
MKIIILLLVSFMLSACGLKDKSNVLPPAPSSIPLLSVTPKPSSTMTNTTDTVVALNTKNGQIVLKLYADVAPNTVANFLKKTNSGFYNGLSFHRVITGFMAQGGDPLGTGIGGGTQASEINTRPFVRGTIGLARGGDKAFSNDSQFFICFTTEGCQHLTGDYVNFGEVVSGLEVLDKIVQGDKIVSITTTTK